MTTVDFKWNVPGIENLGEPLRFDPGLVLEGTITITTQANLNCNAIKVRAEWHTEGRGDRDQQKVDEMVVFQGVLSRGQPAVLAFRLTALHTPVVHIASQPQISVQSVCSHGAVWLNRVGNEAVQTGLGQVADVPQSDTADTLSVFLSCDDDYGLVLRQPSHNTFFLGTYPGLTNDMFEYSEGVLDTFIQSITK